MDANSLMILKMYS